MESLPQSPTKSRPRSRETGFPEPFCGTGNTSLPHPDADLSPNASISADDISVQKLVSRTRRSFMSKNYKRTISYGVITPEMERMHNALQTGEQKEAHSLHDDKNQPIGGRPSKDGSESVDRTDASANGDDDSPLEPRTVRGSASTVPSPHLRLDKPSTDRRKSVLRKLRVH